MRKFGFGVACFVAAVLVMLPSDTVVLAHKPITSKYTYYGDLQPIFRDRCGACHRPDGVAPMSLLTYDEARPWGQSIKEMVVDLQMPPRYAEASYSAVKNGHSLSAREMDMIIEWANGGTPEGSVSTGTFVEALEGWALGHPDLVLSPEAAFTLEADANERVRYFAVPTGLPADRWVRAVDVQPGATAVVRSVVVYIDMTGDARQLDSDDPAPGFTVSGDPGFPVDDVLAAWVPGQESISWDAGVGYRLPARSDIVIQVVYKKTWLTEGQSLSDRTAVGLYLTEKPASRVVKRLVLELPRDGTSSDATEFAFTEVLAEDIDLLAAMPLMEQKLDALQVDAVRPDGTRQPILLLSGPTPQWPARYWFDGPISLPKGSRVEVVVTAAATNDDDREPFTLRLEYVERLPTYGRAGR